MSVSGLTAATTNFTVELEAVRCVDVRMHVYWQRAKNDMYGRRKVHRLSCQEHIYVL